MSGDNVSLITSFQDIVKKVDEKIGGSGGNLDRYLDLFLIHIPLSYFLLYS